jgi:hypothetical protein
MKPIGVAVQHHIFLHPHDENEGTTSSTGDGSAPHAAAPWDLQACTAVDLRQVATCQRPQRAGGRSLRWLGCERGVEREIDRIVRVCCFLLIYIGAALVLMGRCCLLCRAFLAKRGMQGNGDEEPWIIPAPAIPDGDELFLVYFSVGIKLLPYPSPNGGIPRGESGIGSPLPSLG